MSFLIILDSCEGSNACSGEAFGKRLIWEWQSAKIDTYGKLATLKEDTHNVDFFDLIFRP